MGCLESGAFCRNCRGCILIWDRPKVLSGSEKSDLSSELPGKIVAKPERDGTPTCRFGHLNQYGLI